VQEVSNYVAALNHGLKRMRDGFPLSIRLIREIHEVLLAKGRGSPGQFRKSQNWIGGSRPGKGRCFVLSKDGWGLRSSSG
jgi:Fic family protein